MLQVALRLVLAALLAGSALLKLASPASSQTALGTFGVRSARARSAVWSGTITLELALAAGVALGSVAAAWIAAGVLLAFACALAWALARGRAGAPCACFGSRGAVSRGAVARNVALAGGFAAVALLPAGSLSTEEWLGLGLVAALAGIAGLAVAVLALAREVGVLRMQLGPAAALEIPEEGPPLGERSALIDRFTPERRARLALAVFTSEGCHLCQALDPAVDVLAREPILAVERFDERVDAEDWEAERIPGSPFAVALDLDGVVLAKGTFNSLAQLEGVLAAAERRRAAVVGA